jgi:hypothetical protein
MLRCGRSIGTERHLRIERDKSGEIAISAYRYNREPFVATPWTMTCIARFGRIDRSIGRSPCARRSDRPKRRTALAVPRCLRLLPESVRHRTPGDFASPTRHSTADARRGQSSDLTILLSPSARERFQRRKKRRAAEDREREGRLRCGPVHPRRSDTAAILTRILRGQGSSA